MGTFGGALAHSEKRRYILTREQYFEVVYACQKCHDHMDLKMTHDEMRALIQRIIKGRQNADQINESILSAGLPVQETEADQN
jgi:hypothetical protein